MVAAFDRRRVGEEDVLAWQAVLGWSRFEDCVEAVKEHFTESRDWLMPADIVKRVRKMREARLKATAMPPPPLDVADDAERYLAWAKRTQTAIADGTYQPPDRELGPSKEGQRRLQGILDRSSRTVPA